MLWDTTTHQLIAGARFQVDHADVSSVTFSPDSKTIAMGYRSKESFGAGMTSETYKKNRASNGGGMVLWDLETRQGSEVTIKEGDVSSVAFSPDGKTIAAGYYRGGAGGLVLWDAITRQAWQANCSW